MLNKLAGQCNGSARKHQHRNANLEKTNGAHADGGRTQMWTIQVENKRDTNILCHWSYFSMRKSLVVLG